MPVDFLTAEQEQRYGRYCGDPSASQLARYFHLDDADQHFVSEHRGDHNKLGIALQLCTVRFLGTFLPDVTAVPPNVVATLAAQLQLPMVPSLTRYQEGESRWLHTREIRQRYGYHDFTDQPGHFQVLRWLYARAWVSAERPTVLFDVTVAWLIEHKILLPGVTTLTRLIARVRERTATRLYQALAAIPTPEQRTRLEQLLVVPDHGRVTPLDRLRRAPTRVSTGGLLGALQRLSEVRRLGIPPGPFGRIPPGRVQVLGQHAAAARAQALVRMPEERRIATLVAFASTLEATAQDDTLDLLDQLTTVLLARAVRTGQQHRLRTLKDLDVAALRLQEACAVLLDPACADVDVRRIVFGRVPEAQLAAAVAQVQDLARPPDDNYYEELLSRYSHVRRFLPTLLHTITFRGTPAGQPILEAIDFLVRLEQRPPPKLHTAPTQIVTGAWRRLVLDSDQVVDRRAYTFCVLERLQTGLDRRDVFVTPSERWGDPRAKLLDGAAWQAARPQICRALGRTLDGHAELAVLSQQLDAAYRQTAANVPTNAAVRIEQIDGQDQLILTGLDKLEDPASLRTLRHQVAALLPRVDLPETLLEIAAQTGFVHEFTHLSERGGRVDDLALSICAVLIAEACNIGLEPLVQANIPALTRGRLAWVQQNYIRAETLTQANARLVDAQTHIPLAQAWGGGEVASADGLRFVVPVRTLNAGPSRKYFGFKRGATWYNYLSDQDTGFHGLVIAGALRDAPYLLNGLLEQQTSLRPKEIITDTAGYSDIVFGVCWLLGIQFSPRLADVGEARLWRVDRTADYGVLNQIGRHRINTTAIAAHWDDMLRVAGSLTMSMVPADVVIRWLHGEGRPAGLARAIGELGRIAKSLYLLAYLDDETYRRRILIQLNRGERRHSLARAIFHGQRGELRQRYREGQEDQLGALGLVLNVMVLWQTRYMDAALNHLRSTGVEVKPEDVARLSPLGHANINLLGRYQFAVPEAVLRGELRPLRDPSVLDE